MLEQKDLTRAQSNKVTEDVSRLLELARRSHEKYLIRNNNADLTNAVDYYIRAIKQNPSIPETYYRLASLLWENGQISLESAIEQCKTAINIDPKNPNAHIYTGYFLRLANKFDEAEKELKSAIKLNPIAAARPRLILAALLYEKINSAKPSFVEFVKMVYYACSGCLTVLWDFPSIKMLYKNITDDSKVLWYNACGTLFEKFRNNSLAVRTYDDAAEKTGRNEFFYHKIGDICVKENAPEIALDAYRKVLESQPYDREALLKTATIIQTYFSSETDTAIDCYTKLIEVEPSNDKVYYELGHLYLQKGNYLSAVNAFNYALDFDEENPFYHNSLAFALVQLDQYDDAIEHYQKAININPDPIWTSIVCQALGSVYLEIKENPEAAIVLYQTASVLNPQCGMALWENDFLEEAIVAYNKAITIDPEYAIAYNNLGVIYLDGIGNVKEAARLFEKSIEINPEYTLANFNLARACQAMGDLTEAAEHYQKALELNKTSHDIDEDDIITRLHRLFEV